MRLIKCLYNNLSTITFGNFLYLFFFLEGVWWLDVSFVGVNDLVSKTFSDGLGGSEWVLSRSLGDEIDGSIDSSQGWDVDGLFSNNTSSSDSGWILSGSGLENGINEYFQWISSSQKVDNLECVSYDSDGFDFLTSVSSVELHGSDQSFDDWAEGFSELFRLISASSVWDENLSLGGFGGDVVNEAWIFNLSSKHIYFDIIVAPSGEELGSVFESYFGIFVFFKSDFLCFLGSLWHVAYKYNIYLLN